MTLFVNFVGPVPALDQFRVEQLSVLGLKDFLRFLALRLLFLLFEELDDGL